MVSESPLIRAFLTQPPTVTVNPLHIGILPSGLEERISDAMARSRPTEELLAMSDVVSHHAVLVQPPDTRDGHLIRRRNRYPAAASALQALSAARALDSLNSLQTSTTLSNTPRRLPRST